MNCYQGGVAHTPHFQSAIPHKLGCAHRWAVPTHQARMLAFMDWDQACTALPVRCPGKGLCWLMVNTLSLDFLQLLLLLLLLVGGVVGGMALGLPRRLRGVSVMG